MIIVLKNDTTKKEVSGLLSRLDEKSIRYQESVQEGRKIIFANARLDEIKEFFSLGFVDQIVPIIKPYKLVSREFKKKDTIIDVKAKKIGGKDPVIIAGPCAIEDKISLQNTAVALKKMGIGFLRAGAFKPRTSPYDYQGLGKKGLEILSYVSKKTGLRTVTEVMNPSDVDLVQKHADILQVGARNMQNFNLLKALGKAKKPVLLKRGMSSKLNEFLMAAEYIMSEGNHDVILCERGIRTFCDHTRNTLDLNIVPVLKIKTHLPVIVDPSHGTGRRDIVVPMSLASLAAGADGLIIEVHHDPDNALSDGYQSLSPKEFKVLLKKMRR